MPLFYNFHILLATFYTIFGTNILIQCLVPIPVCCMFFVSQKIHIKRSPNGIKTYGDFFWNICEFWEVEPTWDDARVAHKGEGRAQGGRRASLPRGHLEASLTSTPSFLDCFPSKNNSPEGFIPFGLRLIFLFCETLKQGEKQKLALGSGLIS